MTTAVIPWRPDGPDRFAALSWTLQRHLAAGHRVRVAQPPPGPWVKARAIHTACRGLEPNEVVVVADADVWCDDIEAAVRAVRSGAGWAVPHRGVFRLTQPATERVLEGAEWHGQSLDQRPYQGTLGGGLVVLTAASLDRVPLDPRFVGWGQEDDAFGVALRAVLGPPWRGKGRLVHLWHPPQERMTRRRGTHDGWTLYRRYLAARTDPAAMNALLEDARAALDTHQPSVHAAAA